MSGLKTGFANKKNWGLFQLGLRSESAEKRRKKKKMRARARSKKLRKRPTLSQLEIQYLHLVIDAEIADRHIPPISKSALALLQARGIDSISDGAWWRNHPQYEQLKTKKIRRKMRKKSKEGTSFQ